MIKIDTSQLNRAIKAVADLKKQATFAATVAVNRTAKTIKSTLVEEMRSKFDRPTPMVLNSIMLRPATRNKPEAEVWLKNREIGGKQTRSMAELIGHQFKGGGRTTKRIEMRLYRMGILPQGMFVAPGRGAKLDAYGNLRRGDVTPMLTQLGAFVEPGIRSMSDRTYSRLLKRGTLAASGRGKGRKIRRSEYIVKAGVGIFKVLGPGRVAPVLVFIREPSYAKRIDFEGIGQRVANENLGVEFNRAFKEAIASSGYRGVWK